MLEGSPSIPRADGPATLTAGSTASLLLTPWGVPMCPGTPIIPSSPESGTGELDLLPGGLHCASRVSRASVWSGQGQDQVSTEAWPQQNPYLALILQSIMNNRTLSLADSASGPWYNLKGEEHVPSLASPCLCFEGWLVVPTGLRGLVFSAELVSTLARGAAGQALVCEGLLKAGLVPFPPCLPGTQPPLSPASALASWALFPLLVAFLRFDLAALPTLDDLMKLGGASCQLYISSAFKVPQCSRTFPPTQAGRQRRKAERKREVSGSETLWDLQQVAHTFLGPSVMKGNPEARNPSPVPCYTQSLEIHPLTTSCVPGTLLGSGDEQRQSPTLWTKSP